MTILHFPFAHDGCTHYRIKLPLLELERRGHTLFEISPTTPDKHLIEAVKTADAIFLRASDSGIAPIITTIRSFRPELPIIVDTDDDLFDVSPLNSAYQTVGQSEVQNKDGKFFWRDGVNGFDLRHNWHWAAEYRWVLSKADVVTTTTERLAERLREYNELVAVIPNALNLADFPALSLPHKGTRIVWSGGSSHFEDLMMVKPALKRILETYPDTEIHIAGQQFPAFHRDMPERLVYHPWVHPTGHGFRLATLGADIGIAPLVDNHFNHAKSSIKFYEYSALGLATVASNTAPYADDVVDGVTGVLADPQHFYEKLEALIQDPLKRAEIAREARQWVEKERTLSTVGQDWEELFTAAAKQAKEANA